MVIFKETETFSALERGCVATIGKFDGVHLGHQVILQQLKEKAAQCNLPAVVILIEPHPEEFFSNKLVDSPARLSTFDEKIGLLESFGIGYVYRMRFDRELSELSPQIYITNILVDGLGINDFIVGKDFRFGHRREGDFKLLKDYGSRYHFEISEAKTYQHEGRRVSSTYVRELIAASDFEKARELLGRKFSMKGIVLHGKKLGAQLGFPTCNIDPQRQNLPLKGVFAAEVRFKEAAYSSVVNIGYRPTVDSDSKALLEVHILDFDQQIYDEELEITFVQKVRDEKKFDGLEALKLQIKSDVEETRLIFDKDDATINTAKKNY